MCAEKVQRILMAIVLTLSMFLLSQMSLWGIILQGLVIVMILIWAVTDFCPSISIFRMFLPSCYEPKK